MKSHNYFVYILASDSGTLYIWVTSDMERRLQEHKQWTMEWFSQKYQCHKLVYIEQTWNVNEAIFREKQLKKWSRIKKELLIKSLNPTWQDLSQTW